MLAGFTVMATLIGHPFWKMQDGAKRIVMRTVFIEHAALIGGLMLAVALLEYR